MGRDRRGLWQSGCLGECQLRRLRGEHRLGHGDELGESAVARHDVAEHLVTDGEARRSLADGRHAPRDVGPEDPAPGPEQSAEAGVGGAAVQRLPIREVDRRRDDLDEHLGGPRLRPRNVA
ncbi:hypothetical protein D3C87_1837330 [compost metagenome]